MWEYFLRTNIRMQFICASDEKQMLSIETIERAMVFLFLDKFAQVERALVKGFPPSEDDEIFENEKKIEN